MSEGERSGAKDATHEKPRPTCPLCAGQKHRRETLKVYDESASQKRPVVALICARCSHALLFVGGSNLYDIG